MNWLCIHAAIMCASGIKGDNFSRASSPGLRRFMSRTRGTTDCGAPPRCVRPILSKASAMTRIPAGKELRVHLIDIEAESLTNLALGIAHTTPQVSELLLTEIGRAQTYRAERIPGDVVTMHSTVEYIDEASGVDRIVQIVYPAQADIAAGRISILTPIAAGLIGLREGQSISWPDREGRRRTLRIVKVTQPTRI